LLSEQDETKESFLNKLLYSEDIEVSEFDQRSVICCTDYIQSL